MKKNEERLYAKSYSAAVIFFHLGFRLFPVYINKRPVLKGWKELNVNPIEYRRNQRKKVLWAMHCNQGFWVMDVDTYSEHFKESEKAQRYYQAVRANKIKQYTQSGGEHFFFQGTFKNTTSEFAPGIDTKSIGGYIVLYDNPAYGLDLKTKEDFIEVLDVLTLKGFSGKEKKTEIKKDIIEKPFTLLQKLENRFGRELFKNGKRNDDLYKCSLYLVDSGQGELLLDLATIAIEKGLKENEVTATIQSAKKKKLENKKDTIKLIKIEKDDVFKKPEPFGNLFLHHGFNILAGPTKTGKSRATLTYIAEELKKDMYTDKKALVISTENQKEMLGPYIQAIDATEQIIIGDPESLNCETSIRTEVKLKWANEKIDELIYRVEQTLIAYQWEVLFLDPMPRFMDWNNEQYIVKIFEAFSLLGQKHKACIIGVRNDGKTKDYSEEHKAKGSSASADVIRMGVRAITAHPKSLFGKRFGKNKALILTNQYLNSMLPDSAELYQLNVIKFKEHEVALAKKEQEFSDHYEIKSLKYHCQPQSGFSTPNLILYMLKQRRMTRKEITEELPFTKRGTIYQAIDRLLDKKEIREIELTDDGVFDKRDNLLALNKYKR